MSKSILIMDTPKRCSDCTVCHQVSSGNAICQAKFTPYSVEGKLTALYTRPDWCPLIEINKTVSEKYLLEYSDDDLK